MRPIVAGLLVVIALACGGEPRPLRLGTTTSLEHSGFLAAALPAFTEDTGVRVDALAVGTGRALSLLARGDADLAMTHDPEAERAFAARHPATIVPFMASDFLIVGPPGDPADLARAVSAAEAFRRLADGDVWYASRGDSSGTHAREQALWRLAGRGPASARLIETGQGMSPTLRVASERGAYTLADRATFLQMASTLALEVYVEGGDHLQNPYTIVTLASSARASDADRLCAWLVGSDGREAISRFLVAGQQVFQPVPPSDSGRR